MPFCPNCGAEVGTSKFCPSCGMEQGTGSESGLGSSYSGAQQPPYQPAARSGTQYNEGLCVVLCCCLSPIVALVYYLLTDHSPDYYNQPPPPKQY